MASRTTMNNSKCSPRRALDSAGVFGVIAITHASTVTGNATLASQSHARGSIHQSIVLPLWKNRRGRWNKSRSMARSGYPTIDQQLRWRRLQAIPHALAQTVAAGDASRVAAVLIPGVDGQYNLGSQVAIKYALQGATAAELLEPTIGSAHEELENIVIGLTADSATIFSTSSAASAFARRMADVNLVSLKPAEAADNVDAAELLKIQTFVSMVRGHPIVALPIPEPRAPAPLIPVAGGGDAGSGELAAPSALTTSSTSSPGAARRVHHPARSPVEKWPLVQAYGMADLGTGGFLTMVHDVVDSTAAILRVLAHLDSRALDVLVRGAVPALRAQWSLLSSLVSSRRTPDRRATITDMQLADVLDGYAEFAKLQGPPESPTGTAAASSTASIRSTGGFLAPSVMGSLTTPTVLFGAATADLDHGRPSGHSIATAAVRVC